MYIVALLILIKYLKQSIEGCFCLFNNDIHLTNLTQNVSTCIIIFIKIFVAILLIFKSQTKISITTV